MNSGMLERTSAIARRGERLHQPDRNTRIEWSNPGGPFPPIDGGSAFSVRLSRGGEVLQRPHDTLLEARALCRLPVLEIPGSGEEETVQERSAVQPNPVLRIMIERKLEIANVAGNAQWIEADVSIDDEQIIAPKCTARRVKRLRQCMPTALGIGIGPEQGNQFVATDTYVAGRRQHAQESQGSSLNR